MSELYRTIKESMFHSPEQAAVLDAHGEYAYRELIADAEALAKSLVAEGVVQGMTVALHAESNRSFFVGLLGVVSLGAIAFPFALDQSLENIEDELRETIGCYLNVVVNSETAQIESSIRLLSDSVDERVRTLNASVIRPSSGTVSDRKGVVIATESILNRVENANEFYQITAGERVGWFLPLAHHFVVSVFAFLRYRATIVMVPSKLFGAALVSFLKESRVDFCYASPLHYHSMAIPNPDWRPRLAISTTYALREETAVKFFESFNMHLSQTLGIIEIGLALGNTEPTAENVLSVGKPLGQTEARLVDVDEAGRGILELKSTGSFDAYLNPFISYAELCPDDWFSTGDMAQQLESGEFHIVGRAKSVINVYGMKVFPEEVEKVIEAYPGVLDVQVYARPHPIYNATLAADLVVDQARFRSKGLRRHCRQSLESFKIPAVYNEVQSIEKTLTGKTVRKAL